ncbi:YrpD family protein [Paenibacillus sp. FSL H3-0333]|uniref:YrpD family protein n=1 Tax=Paenibacillus sp. FSL H3-0333 TaxID=2921373 RepID=UPI0030F8F12F
MNFKNVAMSLTIMSSLLFSSSVGAESANPLEVANDPENGVEILNEIGISQNVVDQFISEAASEVQKEKLIKSLKGFATASYSEQVYDYISVAEDGYYFYEEDVNHEKKAYFVPVDHSELNMRTSVDTSNVTEDVYLKQDLITPFAKTGADLPDGIGGRQYVVQKGTYISTSGTIAAPSQVVKETGENAYTYVGFMAGANSADMGLMYDDSVGIGNAEKGWKPAIQINGSTTNASFEAPYNQVQSANAYMAGSQVTFYAWYNNNKKIRLKIDGTAICGDIGCSSSADKPLTTIIVSNTDYNIQSSSFQKWKLLSVVTGDNDGRNKSEFTNIKVDGVPVPSNVFPAPDQDFATVTRDSSNNVIITVTGE